MTIRAVRPGWLRARLAAEGFANVQVKGRRVRVLEVTNDGIDASAQGASTAAGARGAGFLARVELDPGS